MEASDVGPSFWIDYQDDIKQLQYGGEGERKDVECH